VVWRRLLLTGLLAIALISSSSPAAAVVSAGCADVLASFGCGSLDANVDRNDVILDANLHGNSTPESLPGASDKDEPQDDAAHPPKRVPLEWTEVCQAGHLECVDVPAQTGPPAPPTPGAPTVVTLRDIAAFRPAAPGNEMQPGGWAVVGLPANFVAAASAQVVAGTLLGQPADVRFTPIGYRWLHSDGSTVTSGGPGATWEQLEQREFTATETSHVYAQVGEYTVTLEVALAAEYRFGGSGWQPIVGTLSVASDPRRVLVGELDTVLTRGDCTARPDDPGC
jgi:hypothetical protein